MNADKEEIKGWIAEEEAERRRVAQQEYDRLEAIKREREVQAAVKAQDNARGYSDDDPVGGLEGLPRSAEDFMRFLSSLGLKVEYVDEPPSESQRLIGEVTDEFRDFLIAKNQQYGDSAIDPVRIFSKSNPEEQLKVRMDVKLSRLVRGDDRLEP